MYNPVHDPRISLWIEASAGTGKTKTLIDRLLALLLSGVTPSKILCITYTKAAAYEMRERLETCLLAWRQDEDINATLKQAGFSKAYALQARKLWGKVLHTPVRFHTLHSFCQSILERFGSMPQSVIDSTEQDVFLERALDSTIKNAAHEAVLNTVFQHVSCLMDRKSLLDAFKEVLRFRTNLEMLSVRSFTELYAQYTAAFLDQKTSDDALLEEAITPLFKERIEHISHLFAEGTKTEQSFAQSLQDWLKRPCISSTFNLLTLPFLTQAGAIRKKLLSKELQKTHPEGIPLIEETATHVQEIFTQLTHIQAARAHFSIAYFLGVLFSVYTHLKEREQVLDFDDLIFKTRALITEQGAETLLYALDEGIDHILLDEAQDTSKEQWEMILALSAEFFCHDDPTRPFRSMCVVGDRKQSIYSFQGADIACFDAVKTFYLASSDKWTCLDLRTSFRSTPIVLSSIDATFRDPTKTSGVCNGKAIYHTPQRTTVPGMFELWPIVEAEETSPPLEPWAVPEIAKRPLTPEEKLAEYIAQFIRRTLDNNTPVPSCGRTAQPEDFLVLMQQRGTLMTVLTQALRRENIVTAGADCIALHDEIFVDDLLAAACFSLYPDDDLNLASLLKSPFIGWTEEALFDICRAWKASSASSLWAYIRTQNAAFTPMLEEWITVGKTFSPYTFFLYVLQHEQAASRLTDAVTVDDREKIDAFLEVALAFEEEISLSLERFVSWFKAHPVFLKRETTTNSIQGVRLMTVHGAKGLQAPFVILADAGTVYERTPTFSWCPDGLLFWISNPAYRIGPVEALYDKIQQVNGYESERLLYVAMTRAQDALYITGFKRKRAISPKSWYTLIQAQVSPLLEEHYDPLWQDPILHFSQSSLIGENMVLPSKEVPKNTQSQPFPAWFSHRINVQTLDPDPLSSQQETEYVRGLAIHTLLEELPKYPAAFWAEKGREIVENYTDEIDLDAILEETLAVLTKYSFLFSDPTASEISFFSPTGSGATGRIDRIYDTEEAIWLIDFKTDRFVPKDFQQIPSPYKTQLKFYYDAFVNNKKPVKVALLWTTTPILMEIPKEFLSIQKNFLPSLQR
ncbi:MAG: UvrD-helicase domain-containing protein [Holosporales bacterium]|nr:UvrD-helicase domain-containing protein [Holosporales bacterium]